MGLAFSILHRVNLLFLLHRVSSSSGKDIVTRILANEFISLGHNISLCSLEIFDNLIDPKIKCFNIFGDWRKIDTAQNINIMKNIIQKENINIVIIQECQNIPWVHLAKKAIKNLNVKIISCLHFPILMSINYFGKKTKFFPAFFVKFFKKYRDLKNVNYAYDNSDLLVLLSERFSEHYKDLQPKRDLKKIRIIPNPLSLSFKKIDFEKKRKTVLFVGRISEFQKRLSLIIDIWKIILNTKKYNDWNLKIVGDGDDLKNIKEMAGDLDRIFFEGKQNPDSYFEEASIFFMTSAFEGFPITLVESLQRGCVPIVMDSFLSLSDVIKSNENGIISPDRDIQTFAKNAMSLMDNEQQRKYMAENGLKFIEKFTIDKILPEWEKLFLEVINA
jgi:glycosyltransferase involved in cell wall biosynthesis